MPNMLTAKEVAAKLDTDARTLRKFLRADAKVTGAETPGKGSRYAIEAKKVASLKKRFNLWIDAKTPKATESPEPTASTEVATIDD